jgi:hypothetical protein
MRKIILSHGIGPISQSSQVDVLAQITDYFRGVSANLSQIATEYNKEVYPVLSTLPRGTGDTRWDLTDDVNPRVNGFDGANIFVDNNATAATNSGRFFDSVKVRPLTVKESLLSLYNYIATGTTESTVSDPNAIHDNQASEIASITAKGSPVSGDLILIEDSEDSNNKKRVQVGDLPTGAGGSDADAIHDNVAAEISVITEKASPIAADLMLIEDSEDSNNKKRIQIGNFPASGGADSDAIHDNVAAEISTITEKASPIAADLMLIEDSEDSNNKKRIQIGNFPASGGADSDAIHDNVAAEISVVTEKASPIAADLVLIEDSEDSNNKKRLQLGNLSNISGFGITEGDVFDLILSTTA